MARLTGTEIRMRLVVEAPPPGVRYSLQKDDAAFDPKVSVSGEPLTFDFVVRVADGGKFVGDFVRREGKERRFVYLRVGTYAGDAGSPIGGRIKADIHDIHAALIDAALAGETIEGRFVGSREGKPVLASVKPVWRAAGVTCS